MHFEAGVTRKQAVASNPDATKIVKVEGGYMIFQFATDYQIWKGQK